MTMKVSNETFKIRTGLRDDAGQPIEAEQQPVRRIVTMETAPTARGTGAALHGTGKAAAKKGIATEVVLESTLGDLAAGVRRFCKDCKHYNNEAWRRSIRALDNSPDVGKRQAVNDIRAGLLMTQNAQLSTVHEDSEGELDVEAALMTMGKCDALTEHFNDLYVVHPLACCPDAVVSPTMQQGFFKPKNPTAAKEATKVYDMLLRTGQGKTKE